MKKLLTICISVVLFLNTNAQSLAPAGAQWSFSLRSNFNSTVEPYTIQMGNDTLVYGRNSRFTYMPIPRNPFPCPTGIENTYMSESNDSIFIYEDNKWQMLVNFNAITPDTFSILIGVSNPSGTQTAYNRIHIQVDSTKTDTVNGFPLKSVYLRRFNFLPMEPYTFYDGWFTQRIGARYGFIPWVNTGCAYSNYYIAEMRCYADGSLGNIQFSNYACNAIITNLETKMSSKLTLYPNPTSKSFFLNNISNIEEVFIYDYTGKFILSTKGSFQEIELPIDKGVYLIRIKMNDGLFYTQKIIKT
ncbi:MAG: T9SS C-terminal target domain-containing protein [Bacteroidetes bacterium]|nr:MAG: T9SS C-terminal target domain-containing protein [Bacteroidota bacterium]MBL1143512.1 T9SS C-terminal target domain-containing protein [Bacteroidota bacterium]NOG56315.1 T9SS type A sorting domain-containing protein [Bacteroidota bacterium]